MSIVRSGTGSSELALLEQQERTLSRERRLLHARIDALYLKSPLDDEQVDELDELEELEVGFSLDRRDLHRRIDNLRAELGLPPVRDGRELMRSPD